MSKIVHYELNTSDPKKAMKFYKGLFQWKSQDMPMPGGVYHMLSSKEGPIGGIAQNQTGAPTAWVGYAEVASVDKCVAKTKKLGGRVQVPKQVIPGMGEFAIVSDPTGGTIGVWKSLTAAPKKATKKRATKKATKKRATKKRSTKKSTKKHATKKGAKKATKKATKKRAPKKTTAKRAAKKTAKKATKRRPAKKTAKKATKKRATRKPANKRAAKKRGSKKR